MDARSVCDPIITLIVILQSERHKSVVHLCRRFRQTVHFGLFPFFIHLYIIRCNLLYPFMYCLKNYYIKCFEVHWNKFKNSRVTTRKNLTKFNKNNIINLKLFFLVLFTSFFAFQEYLKKYFIRIWRTFERYIFEIVVE